MQKLNGVIFDMDGTLLDSMGMWRSLDRRFLLENGVEPPENISEIMKSLTIDAASAYLVRTFHLQMTPEQVTARVEQLAADAYRNELPLKPGADRFLAELAARRIPCAIASVTYRSLLDAALTRLGIAHYFRAILTPEQGVAGKHSPEIYLAAAAVLGTKPEETAVIEDTLYAAKTAAEAGFYTIGFRDAADAADWPALEKVCRRTVGHWQELLDAGLF